MSFRDSVYYATGAPAPGAEFVRTFWYDEPANDLYIWAETADQYVLFLPDSLAPSVPDASTIVKGILFLATQTEVNVGSNATKVVTPQTLAAKLLTITGNVPVGLSTMALLAAAINNDPNFSTTLTALLLTKADLNGSNVTSPAINSNNLSLATSAYIQLVLADAAATQANVDTARTQLAVGGATGAGGKQRFVTLPMLDRYVSLKEVKHTALAGGSSFPMVSDDDVILLDGVVGVPTLTLGDPTTYKRKRYHIVTVNSTFVPVINCDPSFPFDNGQLSRTLPGAGNSLVIVPNSLGQWSIF